MVTGRHDELWAALEARKPSGRTVSSGKPAGFSFRCPVPGHKHDDAHPSGSAWREADGTIRVACHAGMDHDQDAIVAALGFAWQDRYPPGAYTGRVNGHAPAPPLVAVPEAEDCPHGHQPTGTPDVAHEYTRADGSVTTMRRWEWADDCPVCRGGACKVVRAKGSTAGVWYAPKGLVPFGDDPRTWTAEGGKAADALRLAGKRAIAWPSASSRPDDAVLGAAYGDAGGVVIFPDNDAPGRRLTEYLAAALVRLGHRVEVVEPDPSWSPGFDAADLLAPGASTALLHEDLGYRTEPLPLEGLRLVPLHGHADPEPGPGAQEGDPFRGAEGLGFRLASSIPVIPPEPYILDRIAPGAGDLTVLFGPGGAGKGTLACAWVADLTNREQLRVAVLDYEGHVQREWLPRLRSLGADLGRVAIVEPRSRGSAIPGALWEHAERIGTVLQGWGADLVLVDSVQQSCGGADTLKPETPTRYQDAALSIGLPLLAIAHVTKEGGLRYPFGSVHWDTVPRATWALEPEGLGAATLHHQKDSTRERMRDLAVTFTYDPDTGQPVTVTDRAEALVPINERIRLVMLDRWTGSPYTTDILWRHVERSLPGLVSSLEALRMRLKRADGGPWSQVGAENAHRWQPNGITL